MGRQHHYPALDGLRGVAAITVLLYHLKLHQFGHAYLAVDFFFTLSGFVIGHAYEQKLASGRLTGAGFAWVRFARLYPMMLLGAVLGGASMALLGTPATGLEWIAQLSWLPLIPGAAFGFMLNGPQWSLLIEVFANAAHVLALRRLSATGIGLVALMGVAMWAAAEIHYGGPNMGAGAGQWPAALARVTLSYTFGLLLYRLRDRLPRISLPFPVLAIAFLAALRWVPDGGWRDLLAVAVAWPVIVAGGVNAREARFPAPVKALGDISFPLYALHYPFVALFLPVAARAPRGTTYLLVVALVGMAWLAHTYLDSPIQKALKRLSPAAKPIPATA